jgi:UDPglucose 6-dehydrogenase
MYKLIDFYNSKVIQDLNEFKELSDVIIANRIDEGIEDVLEKVSILEICIQEIKYKKIC